MLSPSPIQTFKPAKSDGTLPLTEEMGQFRIRKAINWEVPLLQLGIGSHLAKGGWNIEFIDSDGVTIFAQRVDIELWLVALGNVGLVFFTWTFQKETITTTIVNGEEATPDNLPQYLFGGTLQSEQGDLQPASGFEQTDLIATIDTDWLSPIYTFPIVPGTKVKITKNQWAYGLGGLGFSYAFAPGAANDKRGVDSCLDEFGDILVARVPDATQVTKLARLYAPIEKHFGSARGGVVGLQPSVMMLDDGTVVLATMTNDGYAEWVSNNDGHRLERAIYVDADGAKAEAVLWRKGAVMPQLQKIEGGRVTIAVVGIELMARIIKDGGGVGVAGTIGGPVRIMKVKPTESYSIFQDDSGALWIFASDGTARATSQNGGATWTTVAAGGFVNA